MSSDPKTPPAYKVVVTGFGPFSGHELLNASWEAVRLLPTEHTLPDGNLCHLQLQLVEVSYAAVDRAVKEIWAGQPDLVIHCGVNGHCSTINLECNAFNGNFCRPDWTGAHLERNTATRRSGEQPPEANTCLSTTFNVERLVGDLEMCHPDVKYATSTDVGNYLCGYIYYKSLDHHADRTLFIHVPPIDAPFSTAATSRALLHTIEKCIDQLPSTVQKRI